MRTCQLTADLLRWLDEPFAWRVNGDITAGDCAVPSKSEENLEA